MSDTAASDLTPTCDCARSTTWPLVAICAGYFMVILDTTVVNVALPALSRGLHASTTGLQWVVDGYSLAFAALLLSGGAPRSPSSWQRRTHRRSRRRLPADVGGPSSRSPGRWS